MRLVRKWMGGVIRHPPRPPIRFHGSSLAPLFFKKKALRLLLPPCPHRVACPHHDPSLGLDPGLVWLVLDF